MAANTVPTACRLSTPSRSRAPPECHRPITGAPWARASSWAATIAAHPALPIAPPWTRGSLANATAAIPPIFPVAASAPLSSCGVSSRRVPGSNSAASRASGSRAMAGRPGRLPVSGRRSRGRLARGSRAGRVQAVDYGHGNLLAVTESAVARRQSGVS